jgi:hypothetical protein
LCTIGGTVKWCSHGRKQVWQTPKRLRIELTYGQAIPLLATYSIEEKAGSQRDVCLPMFVGSLFTIAKT